MSIQSAPSDKSMKSEEVKKKDLQPYHFPNEGVTIEASSYEEAVKKLSKINK